MIQRQQPPRTCARIRLLGDPCHQSPKERNRFDWHCLSTTSGTSCAVQPGEYPFVICGAADPFPPSESHTRFLDSPFSSWLSFRTWVLYRFSRFWMWSTTWSAGLWNRCCLGTRSWSIWTFQRTSSFLTARPPFTENWHYWNNLVTCRTSRLRATFSVASKTLEVLLCLRCRDSRFVTPRQNKMLVTGNIPSNTNTHTIHVSPQKLDEDVVTREEVAAAMELMRSHDKLKAPLDTQRSLSEPSERYGAIVFRAYSPTVSSILSFQQKPARKKSTERYLASLWLPSPSRRKQQSQQSWTSAFLHSRRAQIQVWSVQQKKKRKIDEFAE